MYNILLAFLPRTPYTEGNGRQGRRKLSERGMPMRLELCAPCLFGLEGLVADELRALGAEAVAAENGRVRFAGDEAVLARANLLLRTAERVYVVLGRFSARTYDELFEGVRALPLENWIGRDDAFPVAGYTLQSALHSVRDCQAIVKKAAVERLKAKYGLSWFPETGVKKQLRFSLYKDAADLYLDTSGEPLYKRGYRAEAGEAPIRETLAAALCMLSRLRPYHTLYDPMCGSGTILTEGALLAENIAPGLRRRFAAERFAQLSPEVWKAERARALESRRPAPDFAAIGADIDPAMVEIARENAKRAGVSGCVRLQTADVRAFCPGTDHGTVVTNPPYGERLQTQTEAAALLRTLGRVFERRHGFSYGVVSPEPAFEKLFGRRADKNRKLYNGSILCRYYMYYK